MIKKLRVKLAVMMLAIIAAVLLLTTLAALLVSEWQMTVREDADLHTQANTLLRQIRMERSVSDAEIAKAEVAGRTVIHLRDNGHPLLFRGSWEPVTPRETLIAAALGLAAAYGVPIENAGTSAFEEYVGQIRISARERYLIYVAHIGGYRNWQTLVLIRDMRPEDHQRMVQRLLFGGIALAGILLLSAFSWWFTGRSVRPIEAAHIRQTQFIAAASHELRTPLSVLQADLTALRGEPEDQERFHARMQAEISRMTALARDLMALTTARDAMSPDQLGPVEIDSVLRECAEEYLQAARQKNMRLETDLPPQPLPIVEGDARRLKQAVNVLIDNAVTYAAEGGRVVLRAELAGKEIVLNVEDDGPGIRPEHAAHIFERFYRADKSRSDRSHNGLGLSIAGEIAEAHGGSVKYFPNTPCGSRFEMRLPRFVR